MIKISSEVKLIVLFVFMVHTNGLCPKPEILHPCKCDANKLSISCGGDEWFNLKRVFENINKILPEKEKHFEEFFLNNTAITELEENTFFEIKFNEIEIWYASNLTSINTHAFTSTNLVTERFSVSHAPLVNSPPNNDIFVMLSSLINLEVLKIFGTRISEIPSNAFRPILGLQNKLSEIFLENNAIKTIGNYSFYDLTNLFWLDISENPLEYISMNAFNFRNDSNKVLRLDLSLFKIFNGSSFAIDSLSNIKRPTELSLDENRNFKFIDEKIFLPFIESNPQNRVRLYGTTQLDCKDCRSYWMIKEKKRSIRVDLISLIV